MEFKYHCQHQAESFARAILCVPKDYPLREGLEKDFRPRFARLCELAKSIYLDMAKQPENYGLMLVDIESRDHNIARDSYRTIHRLADTLSRLVQCGEVKKHQLVVQAEAFKREIKKGQGAVSGAVPKYELILSRLVDFGFSVSGFDGKPFGKNIETFTVEYPGFPEMIDTIATYCECWDKLKKNRTVIKYSPNEFHHRFYRFDYKMTSDLDAIPMRQWVSDDADYNGFSPELKAFSLAFYDGSLQYKNLKFDGEYYFRTKRIARITNSGYSALGIPKFRLSVKLPGVNRYMDVVAAMPGTIQEPFKKDHCRNCGFQGATSEYCKFRLRWTYNNTPHKGCAYVCFNFSDFNSALVPDYWRLLELEYGLKK